MFSIRASFIWLSVIAVGLFGQALAQLPFGGGRGGRGQGLMAEMMQRVVVGTVEDVNPIMGYIQVGSSRRGSRIVVLEEGTKITQLAKVPLSEVQLGDEVTITGMPMAIRAETVLLSQPLSMADVMQALQEEETPAPSEGESPSGDRSAEEGEEGGAADEGDSQAPVSDDGQDAEPGPSEAPPMGPPPAPGPAPLPTATVTGKIKSVEPFVIELEGGPEITIAVSDDTFVLERRDAGLSAAVAGAQIVAFGKVDDDGYLVASTVSLGETLAMGRPGPGPGRGGPPDGFPGFSPGGPPGDRPEGFRGVPPGGPPGQPPTPSSEEEQSG